MEEDPTPEVLWLPPAARSLTEGSQMSSVLRTDDKVASFEMEFEVKEMTS